MNNTNATNIRSNNTFNVISKSIPLLLAALFTSSVSAQNVDLVAVEKINPIEITANAKMDLALSLQSSLTLVSTQDTAKATLAKQADKMNSNPSVVLAKTSLVAE